ncbi:unnamed protein product [Caenorhabditis brenneri]
MSDWGNAFDEQCRSEGLEVPEKTEKKQSNSEMDPNEENKGFNSGGISRGGMFGGGPKMNAPPPQTSFGATSGTRVGGSYGSTGPDGRGAAIGSSDEINGGGNVISVGLRKEKPACNFSRGGGFGSNRNTALPPVKSSHEGGRFGAMATKNFDSLISSDNFPIQSKAGGRFGATQASTSHMSIGGRFGSKQPASSTPIDSGLGPGSTPDSSSASSIDGSFVVAKNSLSRTSVGGAFGAKSSPSHVTVTSLGGNSKDLPQPTSTSTPAGTFQSTYSQKNLTPVGGSFGAKVADTSVHVTTATDSSDSLKKTMNNTRSSGFTGSNFKTAHLPSGPAFVGGSFGSKDSISSTNLTTTALGQHSTVTENTPQSTSALGSFCFSVQSTKASRGSFGSSIRPTVPSSEEFEVRPTLERKDSIESSSGNSSMMGGATTATAGGGFHSRHYGNTQPKPTVGGSFGASKSSSGVSIGGAFGKTSSGVSIPPHFNVPPPTLANINRSNLDYPQEKDKSVSIPGPNFKAEASFGLKTTENMKEEKPTFESCFGKSNPSNNSNSSPFGRPPQSVEKNFEEKENVASFTPETGENSHFNTTNDTSKKPSFGPLETKRELGANSSVSNAREESYVPFMPGAPTPMRGGFQGAFRGGRGSGGGGQMDFGSGGQGQMGRGRGQSTQSFVPQQRPTPPSLTSNQAVRPDPKYKYTKSTDETHEKVPIPADIALLNKFIQKEVKMMKDTVVDVQRQDPKSPLYSISSFRELRLKPEVLQALDTLNFQFPTRIQETALPLLLMEPPSNLIAQAQSGTGKTAAFVLTMLCRIDVNLKCPQCICLAPTLELAKQIGEVVEKMGKYMENLKIHYAIKGGNLAAMRGRKLTEQIVIGTPGITREYLQKYKCIDPSQIRCLVLDEADVMIYHQGFTDISTTIYNMVEEASESVQSMLFSATYDEPVINFATKIIKNAIVVMLKREEQALPNIKQFYVQCASRDSKFAAIVNLYSGLAVASSVIFCHTKASVMWLYENMKARGHQVDVLHGDMTVVERADTIIRFKRGDFKVLITTNVFARGIDVAQVSVVINYDLPIKYDEQGSPMVIEGFTQPDCETYLHRIGRTGRFGKTGIAINLIDSEDSMNMINILENHFQMKIARMDPSNIEELEAIEMA